MGLSGPKKRTKLSSDPNNTSWANSNGFGHKLLSAQGWKPGQLLGAKDAAQAEHYTAANASHIRVLLREDNLGLGAQLGKNNAETFGLSTLSGIFGRLNGKSEDDVEKMQNAQRDVELRAYQTRKFGQMTFVRGGLLVGDKMEDLKPNPDLSLPRTKDKTQDRPTGAEDKPELKQKKRKHDHTGDTQSRKKRVQGEDSDQQAHEKAKKETQSEDDSSDSAAKPTSKTSDDRASKAARKLEKLARKEDRRKRRDERAKRKAERLRRKSSAADDKTSIQVVAAEQPIPVAPTLAFGGSRQAVRQRYIQQKRLASRDARAMNEILMLGTAAVLV